ncbi:MAG: hypothetical protein NT027_11215 [Proteobacteria bacterium]|nr:hypothetical protein [Pseudomonadota bacterium]
MLKLLSLSFLFLFLHPNQASSAAPRKIILCSSGYVVGNPSIKISVERGQLFVEQWQTIGYSNAVGKWQSLPLHSFEEGTCESCFTLKWHFMSYRGANTPKVRVDVKYVLEEDDTGLIAHEWQKAEDETSWWRNGSSNRPDRCLEF